MIDKPFGFYGSILEIDLSSGKHRRKPLPYDYYQKFLGGRGLGARLLWDYLPEAGADPLSPENPLMFMPGILSGFPVPSASRTCVVTKSPNTSPIKTRYKNASTIGYSNMGGFFGPEIKFAGYDGIVIKGKAASPVYVVIDEDNVEIRDAGKFWGMGTDRFDREFTQELRDRNYKTCYIGPAGENLVKYACIINTAARAAGRAGAGCVMGSKHLKAVAVKGSKIPRVAHHRQYLKFLDEARRGFKGTDSTRNWRESGTASALKYSSDRGSMAVKNYREGTFEDIDEIGYEAAKQKAWIRDFACYCCPLACKKSGVIKRGLYPGLVHDGPEYETGTMFGANLMISDFSGMMKPIYMGDDLGIDIISAGNVIGFLMEAYEKGLIDKNTMGGIDLRWGNVDAAIEMLKNISYRKGIGSISADGLKAIAEKIGESTETYAIHVKGHTLAAWNVHVDPGMGISYVTSNRGACHLNGRTAEGQNRTALIDSLGVCLFARRGFGEDGLRKLLNAVSGFNWSKEMYELAGERVFNLEKLFNLREGFDKEDDRLPERFYEEPLTKGEHKGSILKRSEFAKRLEKYYVKRGWNPDTSIPESGSLEKLGLNLKI